MELYHILYRWPKIVELDWLLGGMVQLVTCYLVDSGVETSYPPKKSNILKQLKSWMGKEDDPFRIPDGQFAGANC